MEQIVPWAALCEVFEPYYPKAGKAVRRWAWNACYACISSSTGQPGQSGLQLRIAGQRGAARVEHVFGVVKRLWGFDKVRYLGLAKNDTSLRGRESGLDSAAGYRSSGPCSALPECGAPNLSQRRCAARKEPRPRRGIQSLGHGLHSAGRCAAAVAARGAAAHPGPSVRNRTDANALGAQA